MTWLSGDDKGQIPAVKWQRAGIIMEVNKHQKYGRIDLDAHGDGIRFSMPISKFQKSFRKLETKEKQQKSMFTENDRFSQSIPGWWYTYPSEKIWKSVEMSIPNIWKSNSNVPNHQPDIIYIHGLVISLTFTFPNIENKLSTLRLSGNLGKL